MESVNLGRLKSEFMNRILIVLSYDRGCRGMVEQGLNYLPSHEYEIHLLTGHRKKGIWKKSF